MSQIRKNLCFNSDDAKHRAVCEYLNRFGRGSTQAVVDIIYAYLTDAKPVRLSDEDLERIARRTIALLDGSKQQSPAEAKSADPLPKAHQTQPEKHSPDASEDEEDMDKIMEAAKSAFSDLGIFA